MGQAGRRRRAHAIVAASAAFSVAFSGEAMAQSRPAPEIAQVAAERTFNIPAQSLTGALTAFGQQSGMQVSVSADVVQNARSTGVVGTMTPAQALDRLLAGSGVTYSVSGKTAMLQAATAPAAAPTAGMVTLDPVTVRGSLVPPQSVMGNVPDAYAGGQVATGGQVGLLGNKGFMDTPFNQTSYTAQKVKDTQAKTINEVLFDDPSIRSIRTETGPGSDGVKIRGFTVDTSDISYGGLYGILPTNNVVAEMAERVEVLKGPSSLLNGFSPTGAIGGAINVVPKRAPSAPLTQFTANYISGSQFGGHADIARRFGSDQQFGVRVNGVYRDGATDINYNSDQRGLGLLGLDFHGDRVRVSADFGLQARTIGGIVGYLSVVNGLPLVAAPSVRSNAGGQPWGQTATKDLFGTLRAEFDITDNLTAYAAVGAHDNRFGGTYPTFAQVSNLSGAATLSTLNISQYNSYKTAQIGLRGTARTGFVAHEFGVNASTYTAESGSATVAGPTFTTNIYNPTVFAKPNIATPASNKTAAVYLSSVAVADTLSVADKRIQITPGLRLQKVAAQNFNATSGLITSGYDEAALSPAVLLVVKPLENVSVYANFVQGMQAGVVVAAPAANAGTVFPPYKSTQYEVGVKVDWGGFTTTADIFQITQPATVTDLVTNTTSLNGEQQNQGLEFGFFGEVAKGVRLLGGMTFLNPILTHTQGGLTDGFVAPFSPLFTANLAGEVDVSAVPGLALNARAIYTGPQYFDTTYPRRMIPEWTRFDIGARYAFDNPGAKGKQLVARFNVENVLDANYWASGNNASTLSLGAPRTFRLSMTADF